MRGWATTAAALVRERVRLCLRFGRDGVDEDLDHTWGHRSLRPGRVCEQRLQSGAPTVAGGAGRRACICKAQEHPEVSVRKGPAGLRRCGFCRDWSRDAGRRPERRDR